MFNENDGSESSEKLVIETAFTRKDQLIAAYESFQLQQEDELPLNIVKSLMVLLNNPKCQIFDIFAGGIDCFNKVNKRYDEKIPKEFL